MSGIWKRNIKLSIFGESHGNAVGIVFDGIFPGIKVDEEYIDKWMKRRAPGKDDMSTPRKESDKVKILSGVFKGVTTGTPVCAIIENKNVKSRDYDSIKDKIRPSHADYTGRIKYRGYNDYRGGGHFSGRLTAPLVFAGALAMSALNKYDIKIASHIKSILDIEDDKLDFSDITYKMIEDLNKQSFPVLNEKKGIKMKEEILKARKENDSIGGIIETMAVNIPLGIGDPFFDSIESALSGLLFSVPAVKGVEFGAGFDIVKMKGSSANDMPYLKDNKIIYKNNNNGGIIGGITNGMPLIVRAAVKPTPSIGISQKTVDLNKMAECDIKIEGRHDPCIVPRAVPVIEACTAVAVLDRMMEDKKWTI